MPLRVPVSDRQVHVLARALRAEGGRGERSGHDEEEDIAADARGEDARHLGAGTARAVHHQLERTTRLGEDLDWLRRASGHQRVGDTAGVAALDAVATI